MLLASVLLAVTSLGTAPAHAQGVTRSPNAQTPPPAIIFGPGKLNVVPSAAWLRAKNEHRIVAHKGQVTTLNTAPLINYPGSWILSPSTSEGTYEPPPTSIDSSGNPYNDGYYGNFCAAGSSTVVLSYWYGVNVADWSGGTPQPFTEPASASRRITTYWDDVDYRAYIMYMAEQVSLPGWQYGGVVSFKTYPYAYAATGDITNALNWEGSRHASKWQGYYFGTYGIGSLSQAQLNSDIMSDIYGDGQGDGSPVVVIVNAKDLPSWSISTTIIHAIAIIGYDNVSQTYTYVETCGGPRTQGGTCGSNGQGIYSSKPIDNY
jgi:hypothetical protein